MPNILENTRTECAVRIFSFANQILENKFNEREMNDSELLDTVEIDVEKGITSCSITRTKNDPAATFTIEMKPNDSVAKVRPGDWIMIYLDKAENIDYSTNRGLKLVGSIDRVSVSKQVMENGAVTRVLIIAGRGIGKILEKTQMYFAPFHDRRIQELALTASGFKLEGSPVDFVKEYFNVFFGGKYKDATVDSETNTQSLFQLLLPPRVFNALKGETRKKGSTTAFFDILRQKIGKDIEGYSIFRDVSRITSGNVWSVLTQASNPIQNEIFIDLRKENLGMAPTLIFRRIPMTNDELKKLTPKDQRVSIPELNIISDDLGFSDHERYNYTLVRSSTSNLTGINFLNAAGKKGLPLTNIDSIRRYGLNMIDRNTEFAVTKESTSSFVEWNNIIKWSERMANYWHDYYRYENGTIVVANMSNFQIGEMVELKDRERLYMVESISIQWSYLQPIFTSLEVTHGIKSNGQFVDELELLGDFPSGPTFA